MIDTRRGMFAVLFETRDYAVIGELRADGGFTAKYRVPADLRAGQTHVVRLLMRRSLLEAYLDDRFLLCYSLPGSRGSDLSGGLYGTMG